MTMLIPERYKEMKHPVLEDSCQVCGKQFEVGDSIEMVPIQKSIDGRAFNSEVVILHTDCYYV